MNQRNFGSARILTDIEILLISNPVQLNPMFSLEILKKSNLKSLPRFRYGRYYEWQYLLEVIRAEKSPIGQPDTTYFCLASPNFTSREMKSQARDKNEKL